MEKVGVVYTCYSMADCQTWYLKKGGVMEEYETFFDFADKGRLTTLGQNNVG